VNIFKRLAVLALVSFALHVVWESLHIRLYTGYEHLSPSMPVTLFATLGDVMYTLIVVGGVSLARRSFAWLSRLGRTEVLVLAVIGFVIAVFVELKGLGLGRWEYLPTMPIIPILNVGLSPILQMTILLPLSIFLAGFLSRKLEKAGR